MNLSPVKVFLVGVAPVPVPMIKRLKALKDVPIINLYGLAEISSMGVATPWGGVEKPGTVGMPLPGTDLRIVDTETGSRELPTGEAGEICFKGPQVMKGYYDKTGATEASLKDGWLFTGDIGFLDEDGYLTILDRKKDLIVASGTTIYPREIDEILSAHPKVFDACTIGIPDEQCGATVKSYVVLKPGHTADVEEMKAYCREKLPPAKVPHAIEFIDALPKSAVGKVLRREVREIEKNKGKK
jgi:long-chain acyl-CoA synthetase